VFTQIPGFVTIILCFACLELACPQIVAPHGFIPYEAVNDESPQYQALQAAQTYRGHFEQH